MSNDAEDKIDKIHDLLVRQGEEIAIVKRGIYGEPENGFNGLIKENRDQEERLKKLEEFKKKGIYVVSGFSTAASFGIPWLIEWVKQKLGG